MRNIRHLCRGLALALVAAVFQPALAAGLQVDVDKNGLEVGRSFELRLTREGSAASSTSPDITPLGATFDVLGTGSSSATRVVNGQRSESTSWLIQLMPKSAGQVTIPALTAGNDSSDPVVVDVAEAGTAAASGPQPAATADGIAMQLMVEQGTRHEHEEIPVTLVIADTIGMRDARLSEPTSDDFSLVHTGEDRTRQVAVKDGRPINFTERRYVLKPRTTGTVTIPSITLQARLPAPGGRQARFGGMNIPEMFGRSGIGNSLFDSLFDRGQDVVVRSEPVTVDILSRPGADDGSWFLPARRVELEDNWRSASPSLRVGEAATRTIRLTAVGASIEQLPELALADSDGLRLYVDRTRDSTVDTAEGTSAVREIDISLVPTRAGTVELPEIAVSWWDTDVDVERTAALPGRTLTIMPAAAGASTADATPTNERTSSIGNQGIQPSAASPVDRGSSRSMLAKGVLASLILLISAGIGWLLRRRRSVPVSSSVPLFAEVTGSKGKLIREHERTLKRTCRANDAASAYRACVGWMQVVRPSGAALPFDIAVLAPRTSHALLEIESRLYATDAFCQWNGRKLLRAFKSERRNLLRSGSSRPVLFDRVKVPGLYPVHCSATGKYHGARGGYGLPSHA